MPALVTLALLAPLNAVLINVAILTAIIIGVVLDRLEAALLLLALRDIYSDPGAQVELAPPPGEYDGAGGFLSDVDSH